MEAEAAAAASDDDEEKRHWKLLEDTWPQMDEVELIKNKLTFFGKK